MHNHIQIQDEPIQIQEKLVFSIINNMLSQS